MFQGAGRWRLQPPTPEMLWEDCDPRAALRERFGLADGGAAAEWIAATVGEHWGLEVTACERIVLSSHNALAWVVTTAGRRIVKWSIAPSRFADLRAAADLTAWLADRHLPVSEPLAALTGRRQVEVAGASMAVQRVIEADLLDVREPRQVRAAGRLLARLHDTLAGYPDVESLALPAPPSLTRRVGDWLDSYPGHLPSSGRSTLMALVSAADAEPLAVQPVHGDFRSANVLWSGCEVAAVLDFEEVRLDQCVVELARSAVLLGTRFHHWGPVSAGARTTFLDGYRSVRPLPPAEESWWRPLVLWCSLAMVPPGEDPTGWGAAALDQL